MPDVIDINFREYRRYTGDNLPGEPVGAPAPGGDPQSGVHNPSKADVRDALRFVVDAVSPFEGSGFIEDVGQSILSRTPAIFAQSGGDLTATPEDHPYYNISIGHGNHTCLTGEMWRNTFVGTMIGTTLTECERTDAFGSGALRFALLSQRNTAIGSLVMQWVGQPKSALTALYHDLWYPVAPGTVGWDAAGLETANPGVGAALAAVPDATLTDHVRGNVGVGRDALLHIIRGIFNTAEGYQAMAHLVYGSNNSAFGNDALFNNVLGNTNTGLGARAGYGHQDGFDNVFIGYDAGAALVHGFGNVIIGADSAPGWTDTDRSILIGFQAGTGVTPADNVLIIQDHDGRLPLIAGEFNTHRVGVGQIVPADLIATLQVRTNNSSILANTSARTLVLEDTSSHGMSILGGTVGSVYFGDAASNNVGGVTYDHSTDRINLRAGDGNRVAIGAAGFFQFLTALPTSAAGLATGQLWKDASGFVKVV